MSQTVWKYEFKIVDGLQSREWPEETHSLSVEAQNGRLCLWALVDPAKPLETREFRVIGTGFPIPPDHEYVGTAQITPFVWHLFEKKKARS